MKISKWVIERGVSYRITRQLWKNGLPNTHQLSTGAILATLFPLLYKTRRYICIILILGVPLVAVAQDTCKKSDEVCAVSQENIVSQEDGIFLNRSINTLVLSKEGIADSTGSVFSGTGLIVSTEMGNTGISATTYLKLKKDLIGTKSHLSDGEESSLPNNQNFNAGRKNLYGIDKMFILLIGVLLVVIVLICIRKLIYTKNER